MRPLQKAALAFGVGYFALGVVGFAVTGFTGLLDSAGSPLLVFHLNPFHNIIHLAVGGLWVLGARLRDPGATEGVFFGIGIFYVAAALLGAMGVLEIIAVQGPLDPINFVHLATGLAAITLSFVVGSWSERSETAPVPS